MPRATPNQVEQLTTRAKALVEAALAGDARKASPVKMEGMDPSDGAGSNGEGVELHQYSWLKNTTDFIRKKKYLQTRAPVNIYIYIFYPGLGSVIVPISTLLLKFDLRSSFSRSSSEFDRPISTYCKLRSDLSIFSPFFFLFATNVICGMRMHLDPTDFHNLLDCSSPPMYMSQSHRLSSSPPGFVGSLDDVTHAGAAGYNEFSSRNLSRAPDSWGMAVHLLPHQAKALSWIRALAGRGLGGVLCDDRGAGKVLLAGCTGFIFLVSFCFSYKYTPSSSKKSL